MSKPAQKIAAYLEDLLQRNERFTGQVTMEIHLKDGKVKDVYLGNRTKYEEGK